MTYVVHDPNDRWILYRRIAWNIVRYFLIIVITLFFAFPVFWVVSTSFKEPEEYLSSPPTYIPQAPHFNHYLRAMGEAGDGRKALEDSLIVTVGATALTLIIGATTAYSLARFDTGGNNLSFWILSQRILPPVAIILPIFLLYRSIGLIDTHIGLILLYTVINLPLCIWMLRSYINDIPLEIEESAMIDGANRQQVLRLVVLPLVAPGLTATTIFIFIFSWTEFVFALVLSRNNILTLPVLVSRFFSTQSYEWGVASAVAVIATLPVVILGLLVQKHFVRGMTMGAVRE